VEHIISKDVMFINHLTIQFYLLETKVLFTFHVSCFIITLQLINMIENSFHFLPLKTNWAFYEILKMPKNCFRCFWKCILPSCPSIFYLLVGNLKYTQFRKWKLKKYFCKKTGLTLKSCFAKAIVKLPSQAPIWEIK
jgi:hypothetical protein